MIFTVVLVSDVSLASLELNTELFYCGDLKLRAHFLFLKGMAHCLE